jgi:hypothetical protein
VLPITHPPKRHQFACNPLSRQDQNCSSIGKTTIAAIFGSASAASLIYILPQTTISRGIVAFARIFERKSSDSRLINLQLENFPIGLQSLSFYYQNGGLQCFSETLAGLRFLSAVYSHCRSSLKKDKSARGIKPAIQGLLAMPTWTFADTDLKGSGSFIVFSSTPQLATSNITGTKIALGDLNGDNAVFTGTGITKNGQSVVTGGTVTGFAFNYGSENILRGTGLNLDALDIFDALDNNDMGFAFAQLMMSGRDLINGSVRGEDIYGFNRNDTIKAGKGDDQIYGGNGDDTLLAGFGDDQVFAEGGNDTLRGDKGNDRLDGGSGDDVMYGGLGNDSMNGGDGEDQFIFSRSLGAANADFITGFTSGEDKIVLDDDIFAAIGAPGRLAASKFVLGTAAGDANDRIIFDGSTSTIWYDRDGTGSAQMQLIATLNFDARIINPVTMTAADFMIID